jgi:hypothetical protein
MLAWWVRALMHLQNMIAKAAEPWIAGKVLTYW